MSNIFTVKKLGINAASGSILILFLSAFAVICSQVEKLSELIKDILEMNAYISSLDSVTSDLDANGRSKPPLDWHEIRISDVQFFYPSVLAREEKGRNASNS